MLNVNKSIYFLLVGLLIFIGCTPTKYLIATNKPTDHFLSFPTDSRVKYEPGAELQAGIIAAALPSAIQTVESAHYRPFNTPVTVFVCATIDSFATYTVNKSAGGVVINGRLFISPKPENTPERLPGLLTHELSHFHIQQQIGSYKALRIPSWFDEGLAVLAANGAGAEKVNADEAQNEIRRGRIFQPETRGSLIPKSANDYGLNAHLFYREASLFVDYLRQLDQDQFKRMLLALQDGKAFNDAFETNYQMTVEHAWENFISSYRNQVSMDLI